MKTTLLCIRQITTTATLVAAVALAMSTTTARAADTDEPTIKKGTPFEAPKGFYLSARAVSNRMSGDFDDSTYYTGDDAVFDVPAVSGGNGMALVVGWGDETGTVELAYVTSKHDTSSSFEDVGASTATYTSIDIDLKYWVFARGRLRPFLVGGYSFTNMKVVNGKYTGGRSLEDERFAGGAFGAGVGASWYLTKRFSVTAQAKQQWNRFTKVDGYEIDALKQQTLAISVGAAFNF